MTAETVEQPSPSVPPFSKPEPKRKKLQRLPANAKLHKRPLLHPAIPSPHANAQSQKVIYVSTHAPFLSIVKRAEKLLRIGEKRLVQSATALAQQNRVKKKRGARLKGGASGGGEDDEIVEIAETVERARKSGGVDGVGEGGEEVVLKGTGKAIQKVLELGLWFQQREEYVVRLRTGSVGAIDDVIVDEGLGGDEEDVGMDARVDGEAEEEGEGAESMDIDAAGEVKGDDGSIVKQRSSSRRKESRRNVQSGEPLPKTRIRYTSVLEVAVSLR